MTGYVNGTTNFGGSNLTASGQDIFIARFSRQKPEIHNIVDVPGDQGGWVRVYFQGSGEDIASASPGVLTYYVFRRIDNAALVAQIQSEGVVGKSSAIEWEGHRIWREPSLDAVSTAALWESVASAPARQQSSDYIVLAPTQADQTVAVTPYNVYFVMAQTTTPSVYYDSAPDSGYSVDNLAPAAPQNLAGAQSHSPAGLSMSWQPNDEHDLANYGVYRGSTAGFVPDAGNRIATPASESFLDPAWTPSSGYYYKVSAFDLHDNESAFAAAHAGRGDGRRHNAGSHPPGSERPQSVQSHHQDFLRRGTRRPGLAAYLRRARRPRPFATRHASPCRDLCRGMGRCR